jgi:hypothetical protein
MDLQTRKINFIRNFLELENEKAISHLEMLLHEETQNTSEIKHFSVSEFICRIEKSSEDSKNGKITSGKALLSEIEKWS